MYSLPAITLAEAAQRAAALAARQQSLRADGWLLDRHIDGLMEALNLCRRTHRIMIVVVLTGSLVEIDRAFWEDYEACEAFQEKFLEAVRFIEWMEEDRRDIGEGRRRLRLQTAAAEERERQRG